MAIDRVGRDYEDLVRLYLTDIGQYTLLTKDDEVRLAKAIEAGKEAIEAVNAGGRDVTAARRRALGCAARRGEEAERQFVQSNLRLVVSIAKKYQASGLPLVDLIQDGNLGLMHAVEKFDWRKGFKFSTYATWWIRQAISRGIANTGRTIRLPVNAGDTLARLQKTQSRLEAKYGRPATLAEASPARSRCPRARSPKLCASPPNRCRCLSRCARTATPRSATWWRTARPRTRSRSPPRRCSRAALARLLAPLDQREREILTLRFGLDRGEPWTLRAVGEHFNLTSERIRQIEARAMSKLRHPSSDSGARDLLAV